MLSLRRGVVFLVSATLLFHLTRTVATDDQCLCKCSSSQLQEELGEGGRGVVEPSPLVNDGNGVMEENTTGNDTESMEALPTSESASESLINGTVTDRFGAFADQCHSNSECPPDQYCLFGGKVSLSCGVDSPCFFGPNECAPRSELGQGCTLASYSCLDGLYCNGRSQCEKRAALGGKCDMTTPEKSCTDGLACSFITQTCVEAGVLKEGQKCEAGIGQCETETLRCDFNEGVCQKKKAPGGECGSNTDCLDGACVVYFGIDADRGQACVSQNFCTSGTLGCPGIREDDFEPPQVLCNQPRGELYGFCFNETILLKTLGAPCDLENDACDTRRGLVCADFEGSPRCLQRNGQCTPGSPFSSCSSKETGVPMECRRQLKPIQKEPYGTSQCLRKVEILADGGLCSLEDYAVCEEGASCEAPLGVSLQIPENCIAKSPGDATSPKCSGRNARYCMKIVSIGSDCSDSFATKCEEGSFCIDGKCAKSNSEPNTTIKFVGYEQDCTSKTCAPGLECGTADFSFGSPVCVKPKVIVGTNELCGSNSTHEIVSALHRFGD